MERVDHGRRRYERQAVEAVVLFSGRREAGHAMLCDISEGGLGVRGAQPVLEPGAEVPMTVSVGLNRLGPFVARVVWSDRDRAGLEVDTTDGSARRQLEQAIRYLAYRPVSP